MNLKIISYIILFSVITSCKGCSRSAQNFQAKKEGRDNSNRENRRRKKRNEETIRPPIVVNDSTSNIKPKKKLIRNEDKIEDLFNTIEGNLMQVEGEVAKHLLALIVDLKEEGKLSRNANQVEQILAVKTHVYENWNYVHDPIREVDTWRSASQTLSMVHKGKYSGDCDDFGILMASFSRQIGLNSRFVGAISKYDAKSGHGWSEFLLPGKNIDKALLAGQDFVKDSDGVWVSLDWFKGNEHFEYSENLKIYTDL